jgi:N-sulfoglucosamine sulfohydrolase
VTKRPNIILMISHDLGTHIGPYGRIPDATPTLNQFAREGVTLENHFVSSPGCSQSRSSLITGRHPHSNGQFGLSHLGWTLNRDEQLLPGVLRDSGYHTAMFGIWHLHDWTLGGFNDLSDDVSTVDSSPEGFADVASSRAANWLKDYRGDQPFYLHVGFWEAHRPFCGQAGDPAVIDDLDLTNVSLPNYLPDNEPTRREFAHLRKSVESVDAGAAAILAALDESGHTEDTIVIFTADHGLPFPRAKGTLYDPGIQVAFTARYPGRIPQGIRRSQLTSNIDVMPTLLDMAGLPIASRVQGTSFHTGLRDEEAEYGSGTVFAEKTYHEHYDPIRALRTEQFKFIRNFAARPNLVMPSDIYNSPTRQSMTDDAAIWAHRPELELYDLKNDPDEIKNLAAENSVLSEQLSKTLRDWMEATDDPLLRGDITRPGESEEK